MKNLILAAFFAFAFNTLALADGAKEISGTVTISKAAEAKLTADGTLFIFAKAAGAAGGPPAAVLRIAQPKFPVTFSLSEKNAMMPGSPFTGPFAVVARYSPTGDAMDKSGPQGTDAKHASVKPGAKDLKIELK